LTFRVTGPFQSLVKPKGPFSEKCIYTHTIEIVRFIVINIFGSLEAVNYFVAKTHRIKAKFQVEVSEYKVLIPSPSKSTDAGVRGPQVTNCCYIGISTAKRPHGFRVKGGKVHPCTGNGALYRPYGP
jgi:hypothetical protein